MGYTTDFQGSVKVNKPVDDETFNLLRGLAETRRMKRKTEDKYGTEGEFYIDEGGNYGQNKTPDVVDYNSPPSTQPSLWLGWLIDEDRQTIEHDGGEKFYGYVEWMRYIIDRILKPRGYVVNGSIKWRGEDFDDLGTLVVIDNEVSTK